MWIFHMAFEGERGKKKRGGGGRVEIESDQT